MYVFHRSNQHHDYMKQKVISNNKIIILPLVCNMYMLWFKISFGAKFLNWFNFYFLLLCIHHLNLEQWQIKFKPIQKPLNQG